MAVKNLLRSSHKHQVENGAFIEDGDVEMDRPSGPYQLHGLSRSGASYMLQIILQTNEDIMDLLIESYTLSLYGNMLIILIIVLSSMMHAIVLFFLGPIVV